MQHRKYPLVVLSACALIALACGGQPERRQTPGTTDAAPTTQPATATSSTALPSPGNVGTAPHGATGTGGSMDETVAIYRDLVNQTILDLGELTRLLGALSLDFGRSSDSAGERRQLLRATTNTFNLVKERLDAVSPPAGYDELHVDLIEAVASYIEAAKTLDVDPSAGRVDLKRFQEYMIEGGKNVHSAGAKLAGF